MSKKTKGEVGIDGNRKKVMFDNATAYAMFCGCILSRRAQPPNMGERKSATFHPSNRHFFLNRIRTVVRRKNCPLPIN